jgi:hypothetical protein
MSEPYQVFSDVTDVTLAGESLPGVRRIAVSRHRSTLRAAGDEDLYERVARAGRWRVEGEIDLLDPAIAKALESARGSLAFTWRDSGGTSRVVTIAGVSIVSTELGAGHRMTPSARMSFLAESPDGATDPVSVA